MSKNLENKIFDNENSEEIVINKNNNFLKESLIDELVEDYELNKKESIKITNLLKVPKEKHYSDEAIYKCFNKKNKTVSFVNGGQAYGLLKTRPNDTHPGYLLEFDHIML